MLIEAFIAEFPDEALGKAVLHRLAWCNVMPPGKTLNKSMFGFSCSY
jgi:hypothetical protein